MNNSQDELNNLREQIDIIDGKILKLLSERYFTVRKIALYKFKNKKKALDSKRWHLLLANHVQNAQDLGLEKAFIIRIWSEIHSYSLKVQDEIIKKN